MAEGIHFDKWLITFDKETRHNVTLPYVYCPYPSLSIICDSSNLLKPTS